MLSYAAAIAATRGVRSQQEDAAALWPGPATASPPFDRVSEPGRLVAVLADGMGGHAGGALASRMACECFLAAYAREAPIAPARESLRAGLNAANRAMAREVDGNRALYGMGSTLVGVVFDDDSLTWISVGDSPLYLLRRGEIALINEDHSLAPLLDQMAREGKITEEKARNDHRRHMLRSAVTGEDIELVDLCAKPLALEEGDCVLIASDGIHTLEPIEISRLVSAYFNDGPAAISQALVRGVEQLRDPHQDNFTVVTVNVMRNP